MCFTNVLSNAPRKNDSTLPHCKQKHNLIIQFKSWTVIGQKQIIPEIIPKIFVFLTDFFLIRFCSIVSKCSEVYTEIDREEIDL